ncbi:flagellar basal body rod protein FlgC [Thiomicrospira sp. ALE5]|uniref:flagellar basal body rod protein FlgC n=1 Tax=Thiomicrospira sp. ALE5 TaxID=748650 RepID=UPI0008E210FE|nr:flagellar basal body rod protein FlgC [Thiomicrospira sp. ALE5]SFR51040.1 flagellar basal-body rod protein FlgC [Thiomicrospira sp. ALE5]
MSLFNTMSISGSAMHAQTVRLNTIASNMANVDSISSNQEDTFRSKQPIFEAVLQGERGLPKGGVRVLDITENPQPLVKEYLPNHPMANEEGYIFRPNVNVVEEMANMMAASRNYETNVEVLNTVKQLALRTIQLGK